MTTITNEELSALKAKAEAATAGLRQVSGIRAKLPNADSIWVTIDEKRIIALPCFRDEDYALNLRDAQFLALATPATVLSLISTIAQLRALEKEPSK